MLKDAPIIQQFWAEEKLAHLDIYGMEHFSFPSVPEAILTCPKAKYNVKYWEISSFNYSHYYHGVKKDTVTFTKPKQYPKD